VPSNALQWIAAKTQLPLNAGARPQDGRLRTGLLAASDPKDSVVTNLLRFNGALRHQPQIDSWFDSRPAELAAIAREWFSQMRSCGQDVTELLHDGHPTACVEDAAFGYVNVFAAHVNVGFFHGASLQDPSLLLQGTGRFMRHVKARPGSLPDRAPLEALVRAAYVDIKEKLDAERGLRPNASLERTRER
jgi:hypothetical protein